jgi:membrane protease YdiL (CAAX protease family)
MLMGWISGVADPIGHLERLLDGHGWVPWIETPVIASQLWLVPETALAFAPGLMVLHQLGVRDAERDPPPRSVWRWTVGVGFAILLAAGTTHVLVDLPTGDLGPPEVVARVRLGTRVIDVALNAVVPALAEELYFRGRLFTALSRWWPPGATILVTTLAFALAHPVHLVPFALVWGVGAGLARRHLGSFWPGVAAHAVWNAVAYADAWSLIG